MAVAELAGAGMTLGTGSHECDAMLDLLVRSDQIRDPNPARAQVTGLDHAVQTATRAEQAGADFELVVCALLHDAARPLSDVFHGPVIAAILTGKVSPVRRDMLTRHGVFQHDLIHGTDLATQFATADWYPDGVSLAAWDAASFDPGFRSRPLAYFTQTYLAPLYGLHPAPMPVG